MATSFGIKYLLTNKLSDEMWEMIQNTNGVISQRKEEVRTILFSGSILFMFWEEIFLDFITNKKIITGTKILIVKKDSL